MKTTITILEIGGRLIVKVRRETEDQVDEAISEVGQGEVVDDACKRALAAIDPNQATENPGQQRQEAEPAKDDFPTYDELDPVPEPSQPQPLAKQPAVRLVQAAEPVDTQPEETSAGEVSHGLIIALKDACESERVEFREPASNEEATAWIIGIRQEGWESLPRAEEVANG